MLIATWNVNSVRTRQDQIKDWLLKYEPDILCLQETKVENKNFPKDTFTDIGYSSFFDGQKSYNGVALISKAKLEDIRIGFIGEIINIDKFSEFHTQKRVISALIDGIRVINVYVPNGSSLSSEKFKYKVEWMKYLKKYLDIQSKRDEPTCILGDFNIAPTDKDLHNPKKLTGGLMASDEERDLLSEILKDRFEDVFRMFEFDSGHWSWWDYRTAAWERDLGWRIDHIYLSNDLLEKAISCQIHKKIRGNLRPSDHAPVSVEINCSFEEEEKEEEDFEIL